MKKTLSIIFALIMCLSLCACGSKDEVSTTEPVTEDIITPETIAGTYKTRMWFLNASVVLNGNTTYDYGKEKGTFKLEQKTITLTSKDNEYDTEEFIAENGYIYDANEHWFFHKDQEYGLIFSPDENGYTDQSFEACVMNGNVGGTRYSWILLDLNTDGTFTLELGIRGHENLDKLETFEGTYKSDNSTLTLIYDGQEYPMILDEESHIIFLIYDKV